MRSTFLTGSPPAGGVSSWAHPATRSKKTPIKYFFRCMLLPQFYSWPSRFAQARAISIPFWRIDLRMNRPVGISSRPTRTSFPNSRGSGGGNLDGLLLWPVPPGDARSEAVLTGGKTSFLVGVLYHKIASWNPWHLRELCGKGRLSTEMERRDSPDGAIRGVIRTKRCHSPWIRLSGLSVECVAGCLPDEVWRSKWALPSVRGG